MKDIMDEIREVQERYEEECDSPIGHVVIKNKYGRRIVL